MTKCHLGGNSPPEDNVFFFKRKKKSFLDGRNNRRRFKQVPSDRAGLPQPCSEDMQNELQFACKSLGEYMTCGLNRINLHVTLAREETSLLDNT